MLELFPPLYDGSIRVGTRTEKPPAMPGYCCFERILAMEGCNWSDLVYIGDNPSKDFVGLNPLGALTVRVLTGAHARVTALPGHDAAVTIPRPGMLPRALATRFLEIT